MSTSGDLFRLLSHAIYAACHPALIRLQCLDQILMVVVDLCSNQPQAGGIRAAQAMKDPCDPVRKLPQI
ncbi:MAG: hypothetical protein K2M57_00800 [Paramuribaculum sp.]|nr:hypothetical protein [Paramuribaculum sp.]